MNSLLSSELLLASLLAALLLFATAEAQSLHPDIVAVIPVVGDTPAGLSWADSYSVGDKCYCMSVFDHGIGMVQVETPLGTKTVRQVCDLLGPGPGYQAGVNPIYNDVQCGNGPPNSNGDENRCPGRVDIGPEGCGQIGPVWNFAALAPIPAPAPVLPPLPVAKPPAPVLPPLPVLPPVPVAKPTAAIVVSPTGTSKPCEGHCKGAWPFGCEIDKPGTVDYLCTPGGICQYSTLPFLLAGFTDFCVFQTTPVSAPAVMPPTAPAPVMAPVPVAPVPVAPVPVAPVPVASPPVKPAPVPITPTTMAPVPPAPVKPPGKAPSKMPVVAPTSGAAPTTDGPLPCEGNCTGSWPFGCDTNRPNTVDYICRPGGICQYSSSPFSLGGFGDFCVFQSTPVSAPVVPAPTAPAPVAPVPTAPVPVASPPVKPAPAPTTPTTMAPVPSAPVKPPGKAPSKMPVVAPTNVAAPSADGPLPCEGKCTGSWPFGCDTNRPNTVDYICRPGGICQYSSFPFMLGGFGDFCVFQSTPAVSPLAPAPTAPAPTAPAPVEPVPTAPVPVASPPVNPAPAPISPTTMAPVPSAPVKPPVKAPSKMPVVAPTSVAAPTTDGPLPCEGKCTGSWPFGCDTNRNNTVDYICRPGGVCQYSSFPFSLGGFGDFCVFQSTPAVSPLAPPPAPHAVPSTIPQESDHPSSSPAVAQESDFPSRSPLNAPCDAECDNVYPYGCNEDLTDKVTFYCKAGSNCFYGSTADDLPPTDKFCLFKGPGVSTPVAPTTSPPVASPSTSVNCNESIFLTYDSGFTYQDDLFRNTAEPNYSRGEFEDGKLELTLGGVDVFVVDNMSGGWTKTFTLSQPSTITIDLTYHIAQFEGYEENEYAEVLCSIDGGLVGVNGKDYVFHVAGGGSNGGFDTVTLDTLSLDPGVHILAVGGYNNRKTMRNESTEVIIESVDINIKSC